MIVPIDVTLVGIVTVVNESQLLQSPSPYIIVNMMMIIIVIIVIIPIYVILVGISSDFSCLHPENA